MSEIDKSRNGVKSIEIGLSILDILIDQRAPMKLKDISSAMQMHPAKIHRYLVSLIIKNYVEQLDDSSYTLGARVDDLGQAGLDQNNVMERLTKIAVDIKNSLNCGVQIARWFNEGPIVIKSVEPNTPISIITRVGSRMPLVSSATGKLLASYQPISVIKPLVLVELQQDKTQHATSSLFVEDEVCKTDDKEDVIEQWQYFEKSLLEIREQGYACATGDMMKGVNAFSIPIDMECASSDVDSIVVSMSRRLGHSITVIGTAEQLPYSQKKRIINKMLTISKRHRNQ
ncbi:IclR family transcriptional regulator [uncultured Psychrobacter sp.]|uniref:IclR family transcriptional regulator n=1 Tax=uncultured Psychrobacter sp. TaxID=259303 RepID=UPI0034592719